MWYPSVLSLALAIPLRAGPVHRHNINDDAILELPNWFYPPPEIATTALGGDAHDSVVPAVMAYYPDWAAASLPPEKIDFSRYDWIDFAFAVPDAHFALSWDDPVSSTDLLRRLVAAAHASTRTKVKLSIGGWGASKYFSPAVATPQSRQTFVQNILAAYDEFSLDGIDIDWEYPAQTGLSNNESSPDDTANFLLFLQLLRRTLPLTARITAAAQAYPFVGPNGSPIQDASAFAAVLDWVLLMNYDTWGFSPPPGPNAPFYNRCHNSTQPGANALAAFESWEAAGFPANKIALGVPSYGYLYHTSASSLRTRQAQDLLPAPLSLNTDPETEGVPNITIVSPDGSGQIQFRDLVLQGVLQRSNTTAGNPGGTGISRRSDGSTFSAYGGFTRYWDDCSSTPYLRSESARQLVTYDDPQSLGLKALFAKDVGMCGITIFGVHGDTEEGDLVQAVIRALIES